MNICNHILLFGKMLDFIKANLCIRQKFRKKQQYMKYYEAEFQLVKMEFLDLCV